MCKHRFNRLQVRARSTNDLRDGDRSAGRQPAGAASAHQQQQQQQQQQDEHQRRTADTLHLMVQDGPWLTTRTLRPAMPDQPNIPL